MNQATLKSDHRFDLPPGGAEECIDRIADLHADYARQRRTASDVPALLQRRLDLIGLRAFLLRRFAENTPAWQRQDRYRFLSALSVYVPETLRPAIAEALGPDLFAGLMARQGVQIQGFPQHALAAGPDKFIPIHANRNSRWPFSRWCRYPQFSQYSVVDGRVRYRNIDFMPGDVLLTSTNRDGNGIFTCLSEPAGYFPHSGFFAILEHDGRAFPSVIETYQFGVRAVPLSIFLHPQFSSYVEVYRHHGATTQHAAAFNRSAGDLIQQAKGYNFDTEDDDRCYISCSTIGRFMFQDAGLAPPLQRSSFPPAIWENLERVGYNQPAPLFPVDYMTDENFQYLGHVDNHHFVRMASRLLVEREFRHRFTHSRLQPSRFPWHSKLNLWAIRQVRRRGMFAAAVTLFSGFDQATLPRGPDTLMAHITVAEQQLARHIRATDATVNAFFAAHDTADAAPNSAALLHDDRVRNAVRQRIDLAWLCGD